MPTPLKKPVIRVSNDTLPFGHGRDSHRHIIVTLIPGGASDDLIELRPKGRRASAGRRARLVDVYSYLVRCEANRKALEKARVAAEKKRVKKQEQAFRRSLRRPLE